MFYTMDNIVFGAGATTTPTVYFHEYVNKVLIRKNPATIFKETGCLFDGKHFTLSSMHSGKYFFKGPDANLVHDKPNNKSIVEINCPTIVVGNHAHQVYYHFLYQTWLPLFYLKQTLANFDDYLVLGPPLHHQYAIDAMKMLEIKNYRVSDPDVLYHIKEAVFTNLTWEGSCPLNPYKPVFDLLSSQLDCQDNESPKKMYISRKDSPHRRIENEDELIEFVKQHDYIEVTLTGMALAEQIKLFHNATHIIAPHGAGLTNLIFCKDGINLIELIPDNYVNHCFFVIAKCKNMNYSAIINHSCGEVTRTNHTNGCTSKVSIDSLKTLFRRSNPMEETSLRLEGDFTKSSYGDILKQSLDHTLAIKHKLPSWIVTMEGMSGRKYRYFINSVVGLTPDARYLEVGSWAGSTGCSAMWGNKATVTCIDNWSEFGGPKDKFVTNTDMAKNPDIKFTFIESDFRKVNWETLDKANIYLFDGPHSEQDQYEGVVIAQPSLDDSYILIVDDYNWHGVRKGTERAIKELNLEVECSIEIRTTQDDSHPKVWTAANSDWHNGYFLAVINKRS